MFRLISVLIFLQFIFSQKKEILVVFNGNNSKMTKFEIALISNLLFEYSKESGERIKLKYKGVKQFDNTFQVINSGHRDKTLAVNTISITKDRQKNFDFSIP
ncbi:MAG: transporter substrate-binding domain-containing protein, partial [Calditrichaeota bacterium]|nr:transporter substrate-binding domain-containing protein [Calditrichota bacterium]